MDAKPYTLRIHYPIGKIWVILELHRFDLLDSTTKAEVVITKENLLNCYTDESLMAVNLQTLE